MSDLIKAIDIYKNVTDGTHDSPKPQSEGFPLVTSKNIKGGALCLDSANLISKEDYDKINLRSKVEQWDVIISMIGEYCGYTYIEKEKEINYAIKNVGLFKTGSKLEAKWLSYYLVSDLGQYYLKQARSGSSQPYIALGELRNLPILNIDNGLKSKIVNVLSALDDKIELNNRINAELESMAKTLYDYWFVQFDFPDTNGKPYKSSGGKMVYSKELKREIPEGWEVKSLFESSHVQYGFPFSTEYFNEDKRGVPVIRIRDILENSISCYSAEEDIDNKYLLEIGDLLIGMDGNFHINHWSLYGCYLNQRTVRLRKKLLNTIILKHQIEPYIKLREKSVSRTTVGHLSDKDLKAIRLIVPHKPYLDKFNQNFESFLKEKLNNQQQNQHLACII